MTSMTPVTRTATFCARAGRGAQLAERLLRAASLMADVPGCELWLVQRGLDDPDMIRVPERWGRPRGGAPPAGRGPTRNVRGAAPRCRTGRARLSPGTGGGPRRARGPRLRVALS